MFDITSSKLFLLAVVALLVIGPKDFPVLLRTIGKYVGIIRGHAKEFRAQFDEAMRESELAQLKTDVESLARETEATLSDTGQSVERTFADAQQGLQGALDAESNQPAQQSDQAADSGAGQLAQSAAGTSETGEATPSAAGATGGEEEPAKDAAAGPAQEGAPTGQPGATLPASAGIPAAERTGA
jgi:sec-independent protein translocase protein TatB